MRILGLAIVLLVSAAGSYAHQPVMDMAPRWADGFGVQTRVEHFDDTTTTWLEGVYTFKRSARVTFKLPYVDGELGDLIVGVPLKKYKNQGAHTSNWSITPSVQLPTGEQHDLDFGLSLSYSSETPKYYQLYDLYAWEDRVGLDVNVGLAHTDGSGSGLFTLWDVSLLASDDGDRIQTGPVLVYYRQNIMIRGEYKALVYERDSQWSGGYAALGIGVVF